MLRFGSSYIRDLTVSPVTFLGEFIKTHQMNRVLVTTKASFTYTDVPTRLHIEKITYFVEVLERYDAGTNIQSIISAQLPFDKCTAIDGQAGNGDMQRLTRNGLANARGGCWKWQYLLTHLHLIPHRHWVEMNRVSLGSDNGSSHIRHKAIIQMLGGLTGLLAGTNFSEILI